MGEMVLFHDVNVAASGFARSQINNPSTFNHPSDSEEKNTIRDGGNTALYTVYTVLIALEPEVEFVHAVSAGGSVKFLLVV